MRFLFATLICLIGNSALGAPSLYNVGNRAHGWRGPDGPKAEDTFLDKVQPVLSQRCVACHGCYEAPCQTNLETYDGVRRGMNPEPIYAARLPEIKPTRMQDAKTFQQWREKKFLPVVSHKLEGDDDKPGRYKDSLMYTLLDEGKKNEAGFALKGMLKLADEVDDPATLRCIATDAQHKAHFAAKNDFKVVSFSDYVKKSTNGGMPFGLPKLDQGQNDAVNDWLSKGAEGPTNQAALEKAQKPEVVKAWEDFFNGDSAQAQHSARYVYEHLFTAHVHFDEMPGEYYQIVRSRSKTGAIDEIVTQLPYDAEPDAKRIYYRVRKVVGSILQKSQIVWKVSDAKLKHLTAMFLESDWKQKDLKPPVYDTKRPNPFEYFAAIPTEIRSKFMLENSKVIIGAMVQGSVCVGSRATYAIRDHFWVWFLRPESDPSVRYPKLGQDNWNNFATAPQAWEPKTLAGRLFFRNIDRVFHALDRLGDVKQELGKIVSAFARLDEILPKHVDAKMLEAWEESATDFAMELRKAGMNGLEIVNAIHHFFSSTRANYEYQVAYERSLRTLKKDGLNLKDLWSGDKDPLYPASDNPNAWLNVTRHGLSSTVQFGEDGGKPQSIWVLSFSNFERLYYNLVVSFKSWGSLPHKIATWRHMSYVRLEGEDLAISFLPLRSRAAVRAEFTRGLGAAKNFLFFPLHSTVDYGDLRPRPGTEGSVTELVADVKKMMSKIADPSPKDQQISNEQREWEKSLVEIQNKSEDRNDVLYSKLFPSITYVKVIVSEKETWYYTILGDRAYESHNIAFIEDLARDKKHDELSVNRGFVGAYPNAFLEIKKEDVKDFVAEIKRLRTERDWDGFLANRAISRNSNKFWPFFDALHAWKIEPHPGNDPVQQGIVDLSQYGFFETKN